LDPYSFCNQTNFQAYDGFDLIYPGLGLPIYLALLAAYIFEFAIDVKKRRLSPILLTKGTLIAFIPSRFAILSLWFASSIQKTTAYADATTFINSIGSLILIPALILIVVSWLDLALIARNLGDQDRRLTRVKLSLFILTGIIGPLNLVMLFVNQFIPESMEVKIIFGVAVILLILLMLATIIISIVYLVIVLKWLRNSPSSNLLHKIQIKSYWIIALLGSLLLATIAMVVIQVFQRDTPLAFLGIEITDRIIEILIVSLMFFFLERSFLNSIQNGKLTISTE